MKKRLYSLTLLFLAIGLTACNLQTGEQSADNGSLATGVAATLQAMTEQAAPLGTPTDSLPTLTLQPTYTETPNETAVPEPGSVEGTISGYPYGDIPRLVVVAIGQEPPYNWTYYITIEGETYFNMTSEYMLPGLYQVVAYDSSGHAGGCPGGVTVVSKETVTCNINDWAGGYPSKPSGVPNP